MTMPQGILAENSLKETSGSLQCKLRGFLGRTNSRKQMASAGLEDLILLREIRDGNV